MGRGTAVGGAEKVVRIDDDIISTSDELTGTSVSEELNSTSVTVREELIMLIVREELTILVVEGLI